MRLGIVTCEKCPTGIPSEKPLLPYLRTHHIDARPVVWNDPSVDWKEFDAFLVRSIWDYHLHPEKFLDWLTRLEELQRPVWNPIDVLRWNHHKFYLRHLAQRGVVIAPTLFFQKGDTEAFLKSREEGWEDVVIKPAVSASGYRTHAVSLHERDAAAPFVDAAQHGDFLVQPFLTGIRDHGEVSLIFIGGVYSHAVLKRPKSGEFRVQAEHGGHEIPYTPDEATLRAAKFILDQASPSLLFARVDGLPDRDRFVLMELELIEPDLFLETAPASVDRFAKAIVSCLKPSASS